MRSRLAAAALSLAAFLVAGCHGITTPSNNVTDTFSGTLQAKGTNSHPFSVSKTGEFSVRLTAWAPNTGIVVGMAWTQGASDGSCTTGVLQQNNFVNTTGQALGGAIVSGKYCIFIFDTGAMTAAQTYTFTVSHP